MAFLLDGKKLSAEHRSVVAKEVLRLTEEGFLTPALAVILVGDNPASHIYVKNKKHACQSVGIHSEIYHLPATTPQESLSKLIQDLNQSPHIHGILLQLPLPSHLNAAEIISLISPLKDVDGLHPYNLGQLFAGTPSFIPCTPQGCLHLIHSFLPTIKGKHCVVIGRSVLVGKPLAALLLNHDATVTIAHSKTEDLISVTRQGDILISAMGRPHFITKEYIKPEAIVIDVGINRQVSGTHSFLVGDVHFEDVSPIASAITPVPGGVGPMTIACLLENTLKAAKKSYGLGV